MARQFACSLIIVALASTAFAQDKDKPKRLPGDEMIEKYLAAETDKLSQKYMDGAKTLAEWKEKLPRLKREYMDMLGLWPIPEKTPLKATVTGQIEAHGVVVEKIHFQSKPGLYVTANLYRPKTTPPAPPSKGGEKSGSPSQGGEKSGSPPFKGADRSGSPPFEGRARGGKLPAIVYVCGHSGRGRDGNKTAFQDHGFWFANNGYVCIVLDTLQLGEIPGVHHGTYGRAWGHLKSWGLDVPSPPLPVSPSPLLPKGADSTAFRPWWWSAGYTPAGVECWNGVRAIDYLLTRPDVDPDKIGVTGISGGGAATFWIAAADERVKVAVPVSGMSDLESYVKNKVVNGHCDCMFLYNTYQWDWTTIAALVAPRPMLFANSDKDGIFPMDGNRRIIEKLRKCYAMYDADPKAQGRPSLGLDEYVSPGGHDYRPDLRVAIFKFINKHLKGDTTTQVEDSAKYTPLPGKDLRVFATDADVPKDAINGRIDERFVPRAKVELPTEGKFAEWKAKLLDECRNKCLRSVPQQLPKLKHWSGNQVWTVWTSDEGISISYLTDALWTGKLRSWVVSNLDDRIDSKWFEQWVGEAYSTISPRGGWTQKSPPNYVERAHALLGRTHDVGKLVDVLSSINSSGGKPPRIVGRGQAGILAAYAALFEPTIKEVVVIDPPKSHKEGPHFLGILRVLDIPEALGLLAPTPLTIVGGNDPAFDRTAEIYRLAGAADKLTRK